VDSAGSLYRGRIRKVTAGTGIITTVVGNGVHCPIATNACGDNGAALNANLYNPTGIAIDNAGNLFIADGNDQRVRKDAAGTGIITTIAGRLSRGSDGSGTSDGVSSARSMSNRASGRPIPTPPVTSRRLKTRIFTAASAPILGKK
jgi:NHL repeat